MRALLQFTLDLFDPEPAALLTPPVPPHGPVANRPPSRRSKVVRDTHSTPLPNLGDTVFSHPQASREIQLGDITVAYRFERARRRTIGFLVGPNGLVVRAPRWTTLGEVDAALREKSGWIVRKLQESRDRAVRHDEVQIQWRDGAQFALLGQTVRVCLDPAHRFASRGAQLEDATGPEGERILHVALPLTATPDQLRDAVQAWLMRFARKHFTERLDAFAPQLQVQWKRLSLSNAQTRWGSARSDGSIRLNWRLMHFSPAIVDYVVVHELSHLRVMDHSPRFWDTVASVVPDYGALRRQLKDDAIPRW